MSSTSAPLRLRRRLRSTRVRHHPMIIKPLPIQRGISLVAGRQEGCPPQGSVLRRSSWCPKRCNRCCQNCRLLQHCLRHSPSRVEESATDRGRGSQRREKGADGSRGARGIRWDRKLLGPFSRRLPRSPRGRAGTRRAREKGSRFPGALRDASGYWLTVEVTRLASCSWFSSRCVSGSPLFTYEYPAGEPPRLSVKWLLFGPRRKKGEARKAATLFGRPLHPPPGAANVAVNCSITRSTRGYPLSSSRTTSMASTAASPSLLALFAR
jgi:hypothetical protein